MTLYAPSNLVWVAVSAEGHGGCGDSHARPVENGAPARLWALDCPACEDHLRHDPMWSTTVSEIVETYDEKLAREDFDKRGTKDKDAVLTLALARLAGIDSKELPESLTRMISGAPLHVPVQGQMECPAGHLNAPGQKFCGECGKPMSATTAKASLPAAQKPSEPPAEPPAGQKPRRLRDARLDELQALATARSIDSSGTRGDLIARLSAAGVTSNDLAAIPVAA